MSEPMTDERLEAYRLIAGKFQSLQDASREDLVTTLLQWEAIGRDLSTLVSNLQTENAAMREIVQEMAHRPLSYNPMLVPPRFQCNHCDASTDALEVVDGRIYQVTSDMAVSRIQHLPDCPVTKVRALVMGSEDINNE